MLDLSKFTPQELDVLLDALDLYEQKKSAEVSDYQRIRTVSEIIEAHARHCTNCQEKEVASAMRGIREELAGKEKDAEQNKKVLRERVTLLKAKLIMLQQSDAADRVLKDASDG